MSASTGSSRGRLSNALQESLVAVVRLRADRQPITDAAYFRAQLTQLLGRAEQEALAMGMSAADAKLALFAVVAFLDESVLNLRIPALADWARRPLQDELFGGHMGGEWFFQHIEQLLARPDSADLAELLDVHELCLLLGFRGKYGAGDRGELPAITARVAERLTRLRGPLKDLAPAWQPPADQVDTKDPWMRRLTIGAIASVVVVVALWGVYAFSLSGARTDIRSIAASMGAPASAR